MEMGTFGRSGRKIFARYARKTVISSRQGQTCFVFVTLDCVVLYCFASWRSNSGISKLNMKNALIYDFDLDENPYLGRPYRRGGGLCVHLIEVR